MQRIGEYVIIRLSDNFVLFVSAAYPSHSLVDPNIDRISDLHLPVCEKCDRYLSVGRRARLSSECDRMKTFHSNNT